MTGSSQEELQVRYVTNFQDFVSMPFSGAVNAICWNRDLAGDFSGIVEKIKTEGNITSVGQEELRDLHLNEEEQAAREILLNDLALLEAHGASPVLNVITHYERDDAFPFFPTDVYSFHVDRSPVPTDTFLCTYYGAPSEILPNAQCRQKVLVPAIRNELRKLYGGTDTGFESFLSDHFFDLHYEAAPDALPLSLGTGHLWRLAVDYPQSQALPCIHRAPKEKPGQKRLLLIC